MPYPEKIGIYKTAFRVKWRPDPTEEEEHIVDGYSFFNGTRWGIQYGNIVACKHAVAKKYDEAIGLKITMQERTFKEIDGEKYK